MIIQGTGKPIVLLHGVTSSCFAWQDVIPYLSTDYKVYAFTALGHNGGNKPTGKIEIDDLVDDIEQLLDQHNLTSPYIVGNSMGGWVAIELAKRGRACGVCAISPAGVWQVDGSEQRHALKQIKYLSRLSALCLPFVSILSKSAILRHFSLKKVAVKGEKLTPKQFKQAVKDMCACSVKHDFLTSQKALSAAKLGCPMTLLWPAQDKLFPIDTTAKSAQKMFQTAKFVTLPNLGHVPMIDDPELVAQEIISAMGDYK